ncbi:RNA-binding family protein with RRM/RBD/RNP motifs [Prunus dulcis]|uniref:RNA-binding family protein with RRM/RBD/RNP motifs n=1 Tax=Prunus dulcis TaxID=3755 RepID=A0A4Y1R9R2_PRUDU|nr:RNA-binding family protein with RRM/RBD/RNP motifs [Prunus dulcis]
MSLRLPPQNPKHTMDFTKKRKTELNGTFSNLRRRPQAPPTLDPGPAHRHPPKRRRPPPRRPRLRPLRHRQRLYPRKLFIRGLGADTTSDSLRSLFSAFGDLDEAIVIPDKATGKSKGYGFVTFKHADSALLALKEPSKKIDGRVTVTQFAAAGLTASFSNSNSNAADVSARKIYVGSVPFDISSERLLSTFSAYGEIEEGPLGFDKATGKSKGAALVEPIKNIDGHQVACKLAVDNKKSKPGGAQAAPIDNSGVPPPQSSMPPGLYQARRRISRVHILPLPGLPGNSFGARYNANLGGAYGLPPPGEFTARLPPSSIGMGHGGYSDGPHYGLGASMGLPSQHQQPPPVPRVPPVLLCIGSVTVRHQFHVVFTSLGAMSWKVSSAPNLRNILQPYRSLVD